MAEAHAKGWALIRNPVLHFPYYPVLLADAEPGRGGAGRIREFLLGADYVTLPAAAPCRALPRVAAARVLTGFT